MKRASPRLVALAAIGLTGCTFIQVSHYMSPAAPGATYSRDPLGFDVASIYSGPPNSLTLQTDDVLLGFACWTHGYTPLLIGPSIFPVFPIVLLAPVLREPLDTRRLRLAVYIEPRGGAISFAPGWLQVIDAHGDPLRVEEIRVGPGSPPRINQSLDTALMDALSSEEDVTVEDPTLFVVEATAETGTTSFRVTVDGVTEHGSRLQLPAIELTPASGLELQMGP